MPSVCTRGYTCYASQNRAVVAHGRPGHSLERVANAALAGGGHLAAATEAVLTVARLERDFWEMAWTGR